MMTTIQLIAIYSMLKQASEYNLDPFHSKILLCVGDMAQLPPIYSHTITESEPVCRRYYIMNSLIWISEMHFILMSSVRHSKDPEYLHFLNIIRERQPTEEEIQQYLGECFVPNSDVLPSHNNATTILYTHCEDVDVYNNFMVSSLFYKSAIHSIDVRSNTTDVDEFQGWLHDPNFNQIKTATVGCLVMLTVNINLEIRTSSSAKADEMHCPLYIHLQHEVLQINISVGTSLCHDCTQVPRGYNMLQGPH